MKNIYTILQNLNINYKQHDHPAVYTVAEASKYDKNFDAEQNKSLFLRNKKGNKHYLVVTKGSKTIDLKKLGETLGDKRIGFASENRLKKYLGLTPGSVSPFGLINDEHKEVIVVIDSDLIKNPKVAFHPNINTATIVISTDDFRKYLEWTTNQVKYLKL